MQEGGTFPIDRDSDPVFPESPGSSLAYSCFISRGSLYKKAILRWTTERRSRKTWSANGFRAEIKKALDTLRWRGQVNVQNESKIELKISLYYRFIQYTASHPLGMFATERSIAFFECMLRSDPRNKLIAPERLDVTKVPVGCHIGSNTAKVAESPPA
jgi:hypothetical protein